MLFGIADIGILSLLWLADLQSQKALNAYNACLMLVLAMASEFVKCNLKYPFVLPCI